VGSRFTRWHDRHETPIYWTGVLYVVIAALVVPLDVWLKATGRQTISEFVWALCETHEIALSTGVLFGIGVVGLIYKWRWLLVFHCILTGHLFWHW
jgi:hypothetical protein